MTNASTPPIPAGWYPDPEGDPRPRWWDGTQWTAQYAEPYSQATAATALTAPEGTATGTPWIWALVLLPLLGIAWSLVGTTTDPAAAASGGNLLETLASFAVSLVIITLIVLFGYLDWRALRDRGVPQPFHWAWSFFAILIGSGAVYAIGRSVIVRRRAGGSTAPMWVAIAILVLQFVAIVVSFVIVIGVVMDTMPGLGSTY